MTDLLQTIDTAKASAFDYAKEQQFTKQQAVAFAILAINSKGVCIATAVEHVCGKEALGLINDLPYTAEQLTDAVRASFFA